MTVRMIPGTYFIQQERWQLYYEKSRCFIGRCSYYTAVPVYWYSYLRQFSILPKERKSYHAGCPMSIVLLYIFLAKVSGVSAPAVHPLMHE